MIFLKSNSLSLLIFLLSFSISTLSAQVVRQWVHTYGQSAKDYGTDAVANADGTAIVIASVDDDETGKESLSLTKFSATGDVIFSHLLRDGNNHLVGYGLEVNEDGTMVIGTQFGGDAFVLLVNEEGTILKSNYDETYNLWDITTGHNGETIACGERSGRTVIKAYTDSLDLIWENEIDLDFIRDAVSVVATEDGGYALLCAVNGNGGDVAVVKTDGQGQLVWSRIYGGTRLEYVDIGNDPGPNIMSLPDGNLVFGASTQSVNGDVTFPDDDNNRDNFWVVKVDKDSGDIIWNTVLAVGFCNGINVKLDGSILAYGRGRFGDVPSIVPPHPSGSSSSENWIGSLNPDGTVMYSHYFDSDEDISVNQVVNYPDGTWLVVGATRSEEPPFTNAGNDDVVVIRMSDGTIPTDSGDSMADGLLDTTICSGTSFMIAGIEFNADNPTDNVILEGQAADGGDSTLSVNVMFFPPAESVFEASVCPGEGVIIDGVSYDEEELPEIITLTGGASTGCDSIINVAITVLSEDDAACGGDNPDQTGFDCLPESNPFCLSQEETNVGGTACIDVTANNFVDIIAFQFAIEFDADRIEYTDIVLSDQLPGLTVEDNFGLQFADEGIITFNYNHLTGESLTLDDGALLFQACFTGLSGGLAPITVTDTILGSTVVLYSDFSESEYEGNSGSVDVILCSDTTIIIDTLICLGQTVTFDDTSIGASGTYTQTVATVEGCDSTTILNVAINEVEFSFPDNIGFCPQEQRIVSGPDSVMIGLASTDDDMLAANLVLPLGRSMVKIREVASGCVSIQEVNVFEFSPIAVTVSGEREYCENEEGTSVTAEGAASYLWSNGDTTATVFLSEGTYTVTGTDENGCETTAEVTIETLPLPVLTLEGNLSYCAGDEGAEVVVSGGQSYVFSNGTEGARALLLEGEYSVIGTSNDGCSTILDFTVIELPLPEANIDGEMSYCAGGEGVVLTASGGTSYEWDNGTEGEMNTVFAGTYIVTVTDENGCSSIAETTVVELPLPEVNIQGAAFYCADEPGATVTATGGENYVWSNGALTATVTLEAGIYTVTATDDNGCENVAEITITEVPLPIVQILGDPNTCPQDGGAVLTAIGGNIYQWSTGATTASIVAPEGDYSVTVTNENGCSESANITVIGDTTPPVILACPSDRRGVLNFGQTEIAVNWNEPFAEDICGEVTLNGPIGGEGGDFFTEGVSNISYEAVDEAGNSSSCSFTVTVRQSDDLTFYVDGDGATVENGVVCIPVRTRDFTQVVTFGAAFSMPDLPGVEYIATIPSPEVSATAGEGFFAAQNNNQNQVAITYLNAEGSGLSLPNEALVFTIKATIPGNPGDCFEIGTVLDLIGIEALQLGIGETVPTLIPGEVCIPNSFAVMGRTYRPNDEQTPIDATDVELQSSDGTDDFDITDLAGRYDFEDLDGSVTHRLTPERDFEHTGPGMLSVLDMARMIFHIRGIEFLTDPYLIIAANTNDDDRISLLDINPVRQLILGSIGEFPQNKSWRFLPVNYVIDPMAPINEYEESVVVSSLDQDEVVDFYGVKIGDLNDSQLSLWEGSGEDESVSFLVADRYLTTGEEIEISVEYIAGQPTLLGYQQTWSYNNRALSFLSATVTGGSPKDLMTVNDAKNGTIRALYLDYTPLDTGELVKEKSTQSLKMTFAVQQSGWLSEVLKLIPNGEMPSLAAVGQHPREVNVAVDFIRKDRLETPDVTINPNPVKGQATTTIFLPTEGPWELSLLDVHGRTLKVVKDVETGRQTRQVNIPELHNLKVGTYYLHLQVGNQTKVTSFVKQ
ncbi:HYR domain-containing protein [Neolewinella aurantiaca]|uniref:HYR domain-containing protein n=1 Tax=Neolewinella aurantiaca TaxID=2602767 RepID=A0A5C7FNM4_9BACT|nr:HYR domain-containing protein [Neolewinella aurantiaca]TXF87997.1 HYR domain-containing protein [Neolewinella aurantiaca]